MTFDGPLILTRIDIPDLDLAPTRGQAPGRRQIFSVARKGNRPDGLSVTRQCG